MNSEPLVDRVEIGSLREWMAHWGDGANWSDPKGETVPIAKATLGRLLDTAELAWERIEDRAQEQPF